MAAEEAQQEARRDGIRRRRPNEVGNVIEDYVKRGILSLGLPVTTPVTRNGSQQTRGYPDLEMTDRAGRKVYIEVKTFSSSTVDQTQRTFYMSVPANDGHCKVNADAMHLLVSFRMESSTDHSGISCLRPVAWAVVDTCRLTVRMKHEFNASNRQVYRPEHILKSAGEFLGRARQLSIDDM